MISFVTPTQGNLTALKRTIESLKGICDEFIVGSVCVFDDDIKNLVQLAWDSKYGNSDIDFKLVHYPFDYIYKYGFSSILNNLAFRAKNNLVLYLNVGEVLDSSEKEISSVISNEYNCYYLDHASEKHRWFRCWDKRQMQFSGLIHEEITGDHRPYHRPLFRFADTEKDATDPFKSKVYNDIKELTYFNLLCQLVEDESKLSGTNEGWLRFAKDQYESMQERLKAKGQRYEAFKTQNYDMYMKDIYSNPEFEKERFNSNHIIEFQGDPKYLGK